jgi:diacylglycerol kinase (ATP)
LNRHCTILLNTRAGALKARPSVAQIQQMAQQIGLDSDVLAVPSSQEMRPLVRQLVQAGVEKVAIAGGDGTVSLAVQEMAYSNTALGILPQGTFNNFATALRLPLNLPAALRVLRDGHVHEVSLGKLGERYFTEVAGVGLFADALALYGHGGGKNFARGLITLARLALSVRARRIGLTLDGEYHEQRAVMCAVANTYRMGYAVAIAPEAKLTDEVLDVILVGDLSPKELLTYFRAFRAQVHPSLPKVTTLRAKQVRVETEGGSWNVHCDDQVVGTTPFSASAQPRALKVLLDQL